jgi:protein arginine kinase activator
MNSKLETGPMKCQFCENAATVHLTKIVKANKSKQEIHLCEGCARRHNLIPDQATPHVDLKALLGLLLGPLKQEHAHPAAEPIALTCPSCGLKYEEFRAEGRLGCPDDYEAFRHTLEPLLERIHRAQVHVGKLPLNVRKRNREAELKELQKQMKAAVKAERYEEAARLRDLIRRLRNDGV